MARAITGSFPESVKVGLRNYAFSTLKNTPKEFRQWANVIVGPDPGGEAGRAFLEDLEVASLGTAAPKAEGDPIVYDVPVEGRLVRATPYTFALGVRFTHEMKVDGRYGLFDRMAGEVGGAMAHQMEVQAHRPLNSGFGTAGGTGFTAPGFDNLALFSNAHTLLRGGTGSNRLATDPALNVTGLELAIDQLEGVVTESNTPDPRRAAVLLIPFQLKWIAKELTESELKPYTGNNEVNPLGGEGLRYMVSHYLTDTNGWFLIANKNGHDVNLWLRESPSAEFGDDFDTKDTKMSGMFRVASWHGTWRGAFGSQGA